jgi:LysW-gamma-L-lysine/LysW-L-ornithine aminotransferase
MDHQRAAISDEELGQNTMARISDTQAIDLIQNLEKAHQPPLYAKRDIAIVRGEGAYLFDSEGKRYLDAMSNYGIAALGHADPEFTAAMQEQVGRLISCHQSFYNDQRAAALEALSSVLPEGLNRFFMSNSGAEAMEAALKFAIATTGRRKLVAARRGYHGRTLGALSATAEPKYRDIFEPLPLEATHVPFNDLDALDGAMSDQIAAIVLEPIQGEGGIHPGNPEYLRAARTIADKHGALLIADEIQTGFRTGAPFVFPAHGVTPDLLVMAKAVGNGFPVGVTALTDAISEKLPAGAHGTTYGANPLASRAIIESIHAYKSRDIYAQSSHVGAYLMDGIRALKSPKIRDVRGRGLMIGVELKERVTPTLRALQDRGVLVLPATPVVFRLLPPLIWQEDHADEFLTALGAVLA